MGGNRYLLFVTDDGHVVAESGALESNNVQSAALSILSPDLEPIGATHAPDLLFPGDEFTVSWSVVNHGPAPTTAAWEDRVYLSTNSFLDVNDPLLASVVPNFSPPLAADGQYESSAVVTLPADVAPGSYLLIQVDAADTQIESINSNNLRALPLNIAFPDITISAYARPGSRRPGDKIDVTWTVTNSGTGPTAGSWQDMVRLSTSTAGTANDVVLTSPLISPPEPLGPGEQYAVTQRLTIPAGTSLGNYYLLATTDAQSQQRESNELNNRTSFAITIVAQLPELVVTAAQAPETIVLGSSFNVNWTVANQGAIAAAGSSINDAVYVSQDPVWDAADAFLAYVSTSTQFPLAAGGSYDESVTIWQAGNSWYRDLVASGALLGDRYLLVVADYEKRISDGDLDNNVYSVPMQFVAPDLTVTELNAPASAVLNQAITVSWSVLNQGTVAAAGPLYDSLYLSEDPTFDASDVFAASIQLQHAPLASGGTYTASATFAVPNAGTGTRYLIAVADRRVELDGTITTYTPEADETNNYLAVPMTLSAAADLTLHSTSTPSQVVLGTSLSMSWTVRNAGTGSAAGRWTDQIFLSTDTTVDAGDVVLATRSKNYEPGFTPLAAGNTYSANDSFTIPARACSRRLLCAVLGRRLELGGRDQRNQQPGCQTDRGSGPF